jgi:hypothetical protein
MPRYKLRTLLILLAVGPPMLARMWWTHESQAALGRLVEMNKAPFRPDPWDEIGGAENIDDFQAVTRVEQSPESPQEPAPCSALRFVN